MNLPQAAVGEVTSWNAEEGSGSVSSESIPSPAWLHVSMLRGIRFEDIAIGRRFSFEYEELEQDGYAYRATVLWEFGGDRPSDPDDDSGAHISYGSTLRINFDA
ncbi:MAG: hypothetical protein QM638_13750 [Nocardioides sp.]|uniref:hypothetical protein n=1 Tax=Nocardioides sp. TaxID=35761 RepID=UPI0039E4EA52